MLQIVQCWTCGKRKTWVGKEPKWYFKKVNNPDVIDIDELLLKDQKRLMVMATFCCKEHRDQYKGLKMVSNV